MRQGQTLGRQTIQGQTLGQQTVLWIDLRQDKAPPSLAASLSKDYQVQFLTGVSQIGDVCGTGVPRILCLDYDWPDHTGLKTLQDAKSSFPSCPIIMLTESHSEALAVWAFRSRVWTYLVKPVTASELLGCVDTLCRLLERRDTGPHLAYLPRPSIPPEYRFGTPSPRKASQAALNYIDQHYCKEIYLNELAKICRMDIATFRRVFKRENGMSFCAYLKRYRMSRAQELLQNPRASVKAVALALGFHDLSYFSRSFRGYVGMTPSEYRARPGLND